MRRKSVTLKRSLVKAAVNTAMATAMCGAALFIQVHSPVDVWSGSPDSIMAERPHAPASADAVLDAHKGECWSGAQKPLAAVPGHVIVHDGMRARYLGPVATGRALDSMFGGADWDVTIVAFCK